jgi:phage terminase large subunit GpA-like protein
MDAFSDPAVTTIVLMWAAQSGKTQIANNIIGYYIHQDPAPILMIQPNLQMAKSWSKQRLSPMLRDTPVLKGKVKDVRTKGSSNTILEKVFPGGILAIAGANSPAGLASRPIRVVLFDEVSKYPPSAGAAGDPVELGTSRTTTFWNKKRGIFSTPTIHDVCRVEVAWDQSDQRYFEVPCTVCGGTQRLVMAQLKWDKDEHNDPVNVHYECVHCKAALSESDKHRMVRNGSWVITRPWVRDTAGFQLSALYSPWKTWDETARQWTKAWRSGNRELQQQVTNEVLGEPWREDSTPINPGSLMARREEYGPTIPADVVLLTAGVDVQDDRLEVKIKGWCRADRSRLIEYIVLPGLTETDTRPWHDLALLLERSFPHEYGMALKLAAMGIDSGGHATKQVYDFCRPREARRVWAFKGSGKVGHPIAGRPSRNNAGKVPLRMIGTDAAKRLVMSRLRLEKPGPGFMHFPMSVDEEYFAQLTAESLIKIREKNTIKAIWKKNRTRNEALDCEVLNIATLAALNANLDQLAARMETQTAEKKASLDKEVEPKEADPVNRNAQRPPWPPKRGGFATRW